MIHVEVSTAVYPTEDLDKVIKAVSSLFTDIQLKKKVTDITGPEAGVFLSIFLSGEGGIDTLQTLHGLIRREEIIDSVRNKAFSKGLSSDGLSVHFSLNKQAAFVGIPNIPAQEEPLGSIKVVIRADSQEEIERLFEWFLPLTEGGKPIVEVEINYVEKN